MAYFWGPYCALLGNWTVGVLGGRGRVADFCCRCGKRRVCWRSVGALLGVRETVPGFWRAGCFYFRNVWEMAACYKRHELQQRHVRQRPVQKLQMRLRVIEAKTAPLLSLCRAYWIIEISGMVKLQRSQYFPTKAEVDGDSSAKRSGCASHAGMCWHEGACIGRKGKELCLKQRSPGLARICVLASKVSGYPCAKRGSISLR